MASPTAAHESVARQTSGNGVISSRTFIVSPPLAPLHRRARAVAPCASLRPPQRQMTHLSLPQRASGKRVGLTGPRRPPPRPETAARDGRFFAFCRLDARFHLAHQASSPVYPTPRAFRTSPNDTAPA